MPFFQKKPVVIEARQWIGSNTAELLDWAGNGSRQQGGSIVIETLEGEMTASLGDWIIKGVKNEFYPCKPDIFVATYSQVDDAPAGGGFDDWRRNGDVIAEACKGGRE